MASKVSRGGIPAPRPRVRRAGVALPARRRRVPRAEREHQILALAEELFAERGYEAASMDELARRAGITKPIIYRLVESKEALFRRCFERAADELLERVAKAAADSPADLESRLRATAIAFFEFIRDHRLAWSTLFWLDSGGRTHAYLNQIRARQTSFVRDALAELAPPATESERRRLEAIAIIVNGAYEAVAHWWRDNPDVAAELLADWLVDLVLPGLERLAADS